MKAIPIIMLVLIYPVLLQARVAAGPAGGFLLSSYSQKIDGSKVSRIGTQPIVALRVGGHIEYAINKRWKLQSGILYAGNGHYWEDPSSSLVQWFHIKTIECPLLLTWHNGMPRQTHFFAGAGLVAAYNFGGYLNSGNTDAFGNILPRSERKLKIGNDDTAFDIRPYIWSSIVTAGVQMKNGVRAQIQWMQGISNLLPRPTAQTNEMRGYQIGLTVSYMPGGKTHKERKAKKTIPKPSY